MANDSNFDRNPLRGCNYGSEGGAVLNLGGCNHGFIDDPQQLALAAYPGNKAVQEVSPPSSGRES